MLWQKSQKDGAPTEQTKYVYTWYYTVTLEAQLRQRESRENNHKSNFFENDVFRFDVINRGIEALSLMDDL